MERKFGAGADKAVRVDPHLHSRASGTASNWWVRNLGAGGEARESYTPPEDAYRMAKRAGMDFVTLTDHETIEGALTLTHHPDFFVGEEVSALFPEDGVYADVLVYGLDAGDHREIQARRGNIYELVDFLREAGLPHVLAHPIYGMPKAVDRKQVEKRLALFGVWEFVNGSRPAEQNRLAREIATGTSIADLRQLAAKHGLPSPPHNFIAGTGGSDDHGGIYGGDTYTLAPKVSSPEEFLATLAAGEVRSAGRDGSVGKMIHTGLKIAASAIEENDEPAIPILKDLAGSLPLLRNFLPRQPNAEKKLLGLVPVLARLGEPAIRATLARRYEERLARAFSGTENGSPLGLLGSLGDLVDGHLPIAPYAAVHGYFGREKKKARDLRRELFPGDRENIKVGVFVDGVEGFHGVGTMYRNLKKAADELRQGCFNLVTCSENGGGDADTLRPVANLPVPLYEGLDLGVPSLLEVLEHVAEEDYDALHVATPGPLGLAAMVAGITMDIPIFGAYHTEFGAYAKALSGDDFTAGIVDTAIRQFYEQCSAVAVPSQATELSLRNRGYRIKRFETLKNGVDTELFHPGRRDSALREFLGKGKTLLLYVGRISREKNLGQLAEGYSKLKSLREQDDIHLVMVGDGPYRRELQEKLGETATFTGFLEGEALARTFASCDVFVFPSLTDTLGRAVVEAQASGLPAVVYESGGPRECVLLGTSGFVAGTDNEEDFFDRVEELLDDPDKRRDMGKSAREFAETLSWKNVLEDLTGLHAAAAGVDLTNHPTSVPRTVETTQGLSL